MTAEDLFACMERRFGEYLDSGVINSNLEDIREIVCETEWRLLYHHMTDPKTLYVVYEPVGSFALSKFQPGCSRADPRDDLRNWLLPFRAQERRMNVAVAHTISDKLLETELNAVLKDARGDRVVEMSLVVGVFSEPCSRYTPVQRASGRKTPS